MLSFQQTLYSAKFHQVLFILVMRVMSDDVIFIFLSTPGTKQDIFYQ